jgi:hypothetical protein
MVFVLFKGSSGTLTKASRKQDISRDHGEQGRLVGKGRLTWLLN